MNLSTARSEKRAKEVGIRKVVGAPKKLLILQFLAESLLFSLIAGILAILMVQLSLSSFNLLVNKQLFIPYNDINFWIAAIGFVLFTGLLAGSYPAFYLSSFKPIKVLKGVLKTSMEGALSPQIPGSTSIQFRHHTDHFNHCCGAANQLCPEAGFRISKGSYRV